MRYLWRRQCHVARHRRTRTRTRTRTSCASHLPSRFPPHAHAPAPRSPRSHPPTCARPALQQTGSGERPRLCRLRVEALRRARGGAVAIGDNGRGTAGHPVTCAEPTPCTGFRALALPSGCIWCCSWPPLPTLICARASGGTGAAQIRSLQ
ncbi:hypothetical protein DFH06DRAFT_1196021 [Mycena polygramma]|nr:hypothetical protein DFH06DRAFT_1196021 [Mycena polygramma]